MIYHKNTSFLKTIFHIYIGKKGRKINLGNDKLTLGEMFQIFECDDEEICNFLQKKDSLHCPLRVH